MSALDWLSYGARFALVLALLMLTLWLLRKYAKPGGGLGSGRLRIVESLSLGPRQRVVLIKVDEHEVLIGVSPAGLVRLDGQAWPAAAISEGVATAPPATAAPVAATSFLQAVDKNLQRIRNPV